MEKQKFLVYRKKPNEEPKYEKYEIPIRKGMTILDALFYIQDHLDSTLAFRYACRGAICGSCSVTVDKYPQLACRTQITVVKTQTVPKLPEITFGDVSEWDEDNEILIEPLPNMPVIKDLVVDMSPFWNFYKEVQPYFSREWNDTSPESKQKPEEARSIEHLVYCILCGLCWTCPVNKEDKNYLGPAALAKVYRFILDTRFSNEKRSEKIQRAWEEDAVPSCQKLFACNRVCPKGVRPGTAIHKIRTEHKREK